MIDLLALRRIIFRFKNFGIYDSSLNPGPWKTLDDIREPLDSEDVMQLVRAVHFLSPLIGSYDPIEAAWEKEIYHLDSTDLEKEKKEREDRL